MYKTPAPHPDEFRKEYGEPPCSITTTKHNPDDFMPDIRDPQFSRKVARAKEACKGCKFRKVCLEYALENDEDGVWGGTSRSQRQRIIRTGINSTYKTIDLTLSTRDRKPLS